MATAILDTSKDGETAAPITLTTETLLSFYVFSKSGGVGNYRLAVEISPDGGQSWMVTDLMLSEPGVMTKPVVATDARVKVIVKEKSASTVAVHLIAR